MSEQPPPWDPYGQQGPNQYQDQPPYQGQPYPERPPYQGQPYEPPQGQQPYPGAVYGAPGAQPPPDPYQQQPGWLQQPYAPSPARPAPYGPYANQAGGRHGQHAQSPRRHRERHWLRYVLAGVGAVVVAAAIAVLAIRDISSHGGSASTFSFHAATIKACNDVLAFQDGNATDTFAYDPASIKALNDADDTPLEVDLQAWVNDLQNGALYQQTEADADKVGADCGAVGIKLFPVPSS